MTEDARLADIRERRARADIEATHLRFPDELAPRWQDVDVLLEENRRLSNEVTDLRAACEHYAEQAKKVVGFLSGQEDSLTGK